MGGKMEYYVISVLVLALIIGFAIPIKLPSSDFPRLSKTHDSDIDYHSTLKYNSDVPYCDEIE